MIECGTQTDFGYCGSKYWGYFSTARLSHSVALDNGPRDDKSLSYRILGRS
jgi:hypothetical protein